MNEKYTARSVTNLSLNQNQSVAMQIGTNSESVPSSVDSLAAKRVKPTDFRQMYFTRISRTFKDIPAGLEYTGVSSRSRDSNLHEEVEMLGSRHQKYSTYPASL